MQLYPFKHQHTRSLQTRQGWGPCPPLINTYTAHLKSTHNVTQVPVSESHRDKVSSHGQAVGPTRQETRLQPAHWHPDTLPAMTVIHILSALCHGSKFKMLQRWISSGGTRFCCPFEWLHTCKEYKKKPLTLLLQWPNIPTGNNKGLPLSSSIFEGNESAAWSNAKWNNSPWANPHRRTMNPFTIKK